MSLRKMLITGLFVLPMATMGAPPAPRQIKPVEILQDQKAVASHFRALGHRAHGGVEKDMSDHERERGRSFPSFSSSFSIGGTTYPFTMIGHPPKSGRSSTIKTVIIPLRMNFVYFGTNQDVNHSFDPGPAVTNITHSPLYLPAQFPNGKGQFVDQMQRAAFWNSMDAEHDWHVYMDEPSVAPTIDIEVTPAIGSLSQDSAGNFFGDVLFDFIDSQARFFNCSRWTMTPCRYS